MQNYSLKWKCHVLASYVRKFYLFDMTDLSMTKSLHSNFCSDSCTVKLQYSQVPCDLFENWLAQMFLKIYEFLWCQFSDPVYRLTKHTKTYMYNTQYHVLLDKLFNEQFSRCNHHCPNLKLLHWNNSFQSDVFFFCSLSFHRHLLQMMPPNCYRVVWRLLVAPQLMCFVRVLWSVNSSYKTVKIPSNNWCKTRLRQ